MITKEGVEAFDAWIESFPQDKRPSFEQHMWAAHVWQVAWTKAVVHTASKGPVEWTKHERRSQRRI